MILGIIAGEGELPFVVQQEYKSLYGRSCCIARIAPNLHLPDTRFFDIGSVGCILGYFRDHAVSHIMMLGGIRRPKLNELKADYLGAKLLARILLKKWMGDDQLLRIVSSFIEENGFCVLSPMELLRDSFIPHGFLADIKPSDDDIKNINLGIRKSRDLGERDIGQSVIVSDKGIVFLEDELGTDSMIERFGRGDNAPGILVKMMKPNQDTRIDIPTIGPNTVITSYNAGIKGIAVESEKVIIINKKEVIDLANKYKIFLMGV
jgi:DUF1009 family protein